MLKDSYKLGYQGCLEELRRRLREARRSSEPLPIQLLTGPRQVGKTTLIQTLGRECGKRSIYVAADSPEASLPGFWEQLWPRALELAAEGEPCVLLLDEIHLLPNWSAQLKAQWDFLKRKKAPVHIVATGSSALRLNTGSRESLAGRFERLTLTHWSASALVDAFDIGERAAAEMIVAMGAYPGAFKHRNNLERWAAYVHDAILEPAVGRDILALAPVRKPALLRQVFAIAVASPAQIVALPKMLGQLQEKGSINTVAHYLELLHEAYLVAALNKFSGNAARRRRAPSKLVVLSNAFLGAANPLGQPEPGSARYGPWLENACLAHAINAGQEVLYWREEPLEVDAVFEGSWGEWVVEIKQGVAQLSDLRALLEFHRRFPKYRPLLVADRASRDAAERAGVSFIEWREFLLRGVQSLA